MKTYSISIIVIMLVLLASACGPGVPTPIPGPGSTRVSEKDGMELVYVPAGEFLMGSVEEEGALAQRDQLPQHAVTLDAFRMDRTPVTNAMFARCVEDGK
jgi:formylglycine-generating enzyme required for sulfatase activity